MSGMDKNICILNFSVTPAKWDLHFSNVTGVITFMTVGFYIHSYSTDVCSDAE